MKAGDIVFVRGHNMISSAIRLFDKGSFSHVAIAVSPTHIVEAEYSTKVRISQFDYKDYEIIDIGLSDADRDALIHDAIEAVGKWYDYLQILGYVLSPDTFFGSPNAFICSELAHVLLKKRGFHIGTRFTKPNEFYQLILPYKKTA